MKKISLALLLLVLILSGCRIFGDALKPDFSLKGGVYQSVQTLEMTALESKTNIFYTLDGSDPNLDSIRYEKPIVIDRSVTVKAVGILYDEVSNEQSAEFKIQCNPVTVSHLGAIYYDIQIVKLECATDGARICYTVDGSVPDVDSLEYIAPLNIFQTSRIRAVAFKDSWESGESIDELFELKCEKPLLNLESMTSTTAVELLFSSETPYCQIYYTLDGLVPDSSSILFDGPFNVTSETSVHVISVRDGWTDSDIAVADYLITGQVESPVLSVLSGTYSESFFLNLNCTVLDALIYYTLDGTAPTKLSFRYIDPIKVNRNLTVTATAFKEDWDHSETVSCYYSMVCSQPTYSIESGFLTSAQDVEILCDTKEVDIFYTLDGSQPTSNSLKYTSALSLTDSCSIQSVAIRSGWESSAIASGEFVITGKVSAPIISIDSGTFSDSFSVSISSPDDFSEIYYTLNGDDPDLNSQTYSSILLIDKICELKVFAIKENWEPSDTISRLYVMKCSQPTFNPSAGTYLNSSRISLHGETDDSEIFYTLDGSTPSAISTQYSGSFEILESCNIRAVAILDGWENSIETAYEYVISKQVASPVFSNGSSTFSSEFSMTMEVDTLGAKIHYTTDGSEPTSSSSEYTSPILIDKSVHLRATAFKSDMEPSLSVQAYYRFRCSNVTFSRYSSTYYDEMTVELSSVTNEGEIRYTLDGKDPDQNSILYTSPVLIDCSLKIKASCFKEGWVTSDINYRDYVMKCSHTPISIGWHLDQDRPCTVSLFKPDSAFLYYYTTDGSDPTSESALYMEPFKIYRSCVLKFIATRTGWINGEISSRTLEFFCPPPRASWMYASGPLTAPLSIDFYPSDDYDLNEKFYYTTDGSIPNHSSKFVEPGDGITIFEDTSVQVMLVRDGWQDSIVSVFDYIIIPKKPKLTQSFSVDSNCWIVTLTCYEQDRTIYYTDDGSDPTAASTLYSGPFVVTETTEIKAIVINNSIPDKQSSISRRVYNITGSTPSLSVLSGTYTNGFELKITTSDLGGVFHYTLDGSVPTASSLVTEGTLWIDESCLVKVVYFKGGAGSSIASANYIFKCEEVLASHESGSSIEDIDLVLECGTLNASIYYTMDGSVPNDNSNLYLGLLHLNMDQYYLIKAIAIKDGYADSSVLERNYYKGSETKLLDIPVCFNSYLALDAHDNSHVFIATSSSESDMNIKLKYLHNIGGVWTVPVVIADNCLPLLYPSIVIDEGGKIHIAYLNYFDQSLKYLTNANGNWVMENLALSCQIEEGSSASMALDTLGNVHIVYTFQKSLCYITNQSGTWEKSNLATANGMDNIGGSPSIIIDQNDRIHIMSFSETDSKIHYFENSTGIWTNTALFDKPVLGWENNFFCDSLGDLHFTGSYHERSSNLDYLIYATNKSGSWEYELVGEYSKVTFSHMIQTTSLGEPVIVFHNTDQVVVAKKKDAEWTSYPLASYNYMPGCVGALDGSDLLHFIRATESELMYAEVDISDF